MVESGSKCRQPGYRGHTLDHGASHQACCAYDRQEMRQRRSQWGRPQSRGQSTHKADGQCPFYLGKLYLLFFSSLTQCLSRATEGRVGLHWLTISEEFPSATMGKVQQNMWLVGDGHGEFLTLWFRQEAEDTVWNQEWVDSPETSSY